MEKSILFKDQMVQAILEERKTQTRRIMKIQPPAGRCRLYLAGHRLVRWILVDDAGQFIDSSKQPVFAKPYEINDRLWVREAWRPSAPPEPATIYYRAGGFKDVLDHKDDLRVNGNDRPGVWRPSIYMPRWASRIALDVISVRAERLQRINEADAISEGCSLFNPVADFAMLWDSINAKRGFGWDANPWVWVLEFKMVGDK